MPVPKIIDTVGAGDAFAAIALIGLMRDWPLAIILERTQAFAARIIAQRGAISRDAGLYLDFIARWRQDIQ